MKETKAESSDVAKGYVLPIWRVRKRTVSGKGEDESEGDAATKKTVSPDARGKMSAPTTPL
jgi:hypothetical protein